ncbi:MAG TPA: homoserine dehydrogenase, partial [Beijerinckia sp.]|nr:homoserine dehydrogenase [Beijerinckia sp.]
MLPPLRVGIAGLGTVGAAVIKLLDRQSEALTSRLGRQIVVTGISARDIGKERGIDLSGLAWFDDPVALAQSQTIDLFVELIGGDEGVARGAAETALSAGKSVVTANKALLAKHGMKLAGLAEERGLALAFEASVAGGIPIVKTLREGLAGNSIERVYGILNGTCNYILSRMEMEGLSFTECLAEAQRLGYAEADPSFDIGGFDTAHKLAILTSLAFGTAIDRDSIAVEGIELISLADLEAAAELGYRVKLL